VETRAPNAWGLYDMCGNVWEWCADGLSTPDPGTYRVVCGGSWADPSSSSTSESRNRFAPTLRTSDVGFRVAAVSAEILKPPVTLTLTPGPVLVSPNVPRAVPKSPDERVTLLKAGTQAGEEQGVEIADGVRVTMCWVPAGTFTMGSSVREAGRFSNEDPMPVQLSQGFWLAKTPCDQQTWSAIMKTNPSHFNSGILPVERVSWNDCQAFVGTLRPLGGGWRFALPTEAQWEYACRAGTTGEYAGNLDAMAWNNANSNETTHPVGTKQANMWGLQDMQGNVRQWCRDAYESKLPGGIDPEVKNGVGRVNRGGSWFTSGLDGRSAHRNFNSPDFVCSYLGFRLAAVPTEGAP
jgi:formylglycine-generating enzyme required for sulfatase activity